MNPELVEVINNFIDKLPAILPSVVAIVTLAVGYKTGKRQSSLNLITSGRIEWQETIRNELAEFLKDVYFVYLHLLNQVDKENTFELESNLPTLSKAVAEGNRLILRLNPTEDAKIIEIINEIVDFQLPDKPEDVDEYFKKTDALLTKLIEESHIMLKKEWEKIKTEAGHKRRR